MALEKSDGTSMGRRVTFSLKAPAAAEVTLVGDFNRWEEGATPLKRDDNGKWRVTLTLVPGKYEFKFKVDGRWREASKREPTVCNAFGTVNNVLIVPEK